MDLVKTLPYLTFGISRNTNLEYQSHCGSLVLDCSHAKFTVQLEYSLLANVYIAITISAG